MKKTFYEILWEMCEAHELIEDWIKKGYLIYSNSRYVWHPDVLFFLGQQEDIEIVGKLVQETKQVEDLTNEVLKGKKKVNYDSPIDWIDSFRDKFSSKNLGVTGKTTDIKTVTRKMNMFLEEYDYTKDEILSATDLYINTLKKNGSINYVRGCGYFIYKKIDGVNQSDLANYCEEFRNNGSRASYNSRTIL